jgi:hypothetical protein
MQTLNRDVTLSSWQWHDMACRSAMVQRSRHKLLQRHNSLPPVINSTNHNDMPMEGVTEGRLLRFFTTEILL